MEQDNNNVNNNYDSNFNEPNKLNIILGIAGSILMIIGVFSPLIKGPEIEVLNLLQWSLSAGIGIFFFTVISIIITLLHKYNGLWFTSIVSLLIIGYTLFTIKAGLPGLRIKIGELVNNDLSPEELDEIINVLQIQWGGFILILGLVFLLISSVNGTIH